MKISKPLEELLDTVRDIEGFPIGKDEDILELSDPPYYTACPNPYIDDFIKEYGKPYNEETDDYHREPFVADVSEGKNDPIYNAHSYHTKVPHKAIMKYIEHYTEEGDIVFDGFCGTGMTGVAAQLLGRRAILSDLSPIATFIAYNYNKKVNVEEFEREARRILEEVEQECGWMYETNHYRADMLKDGKPRNLGKGKINYTVWSDVFICPYCGNEIVFWDAAVDKEEGKVKKEFECPSCSAGMKKTECKRATITFFDKAIGEEVTQAKQVPVLINYTYKKQRFEKVPDKDDLELIKKIESMDIPYWFPTNRMPEGDEARRNDRFGITHVHHFYTKRNLWVLSCLSEKLKNRLEFFFTSLLINTSKMGRYGKRTGNVSGTLYIPSLIKDLNVLLYAKRKLDGPKGFLKPLLILENSLYNGVNISTQSLVSINIHLTNSIDYIFTDPPFGDNLMYSELNFLWESWLKVFTNNKSEAIINKTQSKALDEYKELMLNSFKEYYRVLKPNRWITVVFHNSKSSVWNAIQEAMTKAGFIIATVAILDKKQGSFKQVTSAGAVKNDLVINAYKPKKEFEDKFLEKAGEGIEVEFIKMHLTNLPVETTIERTEQMLYSRMLAYYVQHGYLIRYNSKTFYQMLRENFVEIDGLWFTNEQKESYLEYKKKMKLDDIVKEVKGFEKLLIFDERTALRWLYEFINEPKDYSTIYTAYTKVTNFTPQDNVPELKTLLENNFIEESGKYRRPKTEEEKLTLIQKRERELLREFENILFEAKAGKKKIKQCRKEALINGFEHCYKNGRFTDILTIAKRLDKKIIDNSSDLKEFIEIAEIKVEGF